MRKGWTETTLGEIAEYINGFPFKPTDLGEVGAPVIRIKQLLDPLEKVDRTEAQVPSRCVLSDGDIVFSWSGTLAVRVWNRGHAYLNQHLFRVVEKPGVLHEWLPLVIDHAIDALLEKSHGTTMKHITKQTLLPHEILLPPLSEQKRIVDLVSSIDEYIDALQHQAASARVARNAVLHELIVAPSKQLKKIEDFVFLKRGHDLPTQSRVNGEYPVIASNGTVGWHNEQIGPIPGVVTGRSGTIGKVFLITDGYWPLNTTLYVTEFMGNDERFVALTLETMHLEKFAGGTTVPSLDRKVLRSELVFAPSIDEQKRIVEIVSSMDEVIESTEQAVVDAKALRSGLLSDLLSGNHEIPASYDSLLGAA